MSEDLTFYINGHQFHLTKDIDIRLTLLTFLRKNGLTGTKLGCAEGGCGACTVMLSTYDLSNKTIRHFSANACLLPLCSLDGHHVTTVEGIGGTKKGLHPIQARLASFHGSQCGFCTPGIVMAIYAYFRENPKATPHEIEEAMDGNLCRCTGYRPIIDAAKSLGNRDNFQCGVNCPCMKGDVSDDNPADSNCKSGSGCCSSSTESLMHKHNSLEESIMTQGLAEPIFPPALMRHAPRELKISNGGITWFQPITLPALIALKQEHPHARIVVGNTEVGIETKFKGMEYSVLINPSHISELKASRVEENGVRFGAAVTINAIRNFIKDLTTSHPSIPAYALRGLIAFSDMATWFASNHIRNVAAIGGNIVTASPISDLNPMLLALGAELTIVSSDGSRQLPISQFFLSYRKVNLAPTELLLDIFIPFTSQWEFVMPFKQARRREDDISIVTAGLRFRLAPLADDKEWRIEDCDLCFGGMAPTSIRANKTVESLVGKAWNHSTLQLGMDSIHGELSLPENVPGGQGEYRLALAVSSLFRAFLRMSIDLQAAVDAQREEEKLVRTNAPSMLPDAPIIAESDRSAANSFLTSEKPVTRGEQSFTMATGGLTNNNDDTAERKPVGESLMHKSADLQVTGEAIYVDDIPAPSNALYAVLVTSQRAHARILNIDISEAAKCEGFHGYASASDVQGSNMIGVIIKDEEVFVTEEAKYFGAVLGVIVASTHNQALYAAARVKVEYEDLPAVLDITQAIAADSFHQCRVHRHALEIGDINEAESESTTIVEGEMWAGGQEHFYLETQSSIITPLENGQFEVWSSTQSLTKTQTSIAHVCGVPSAHVVARCKRMGGGFGGKETRSVFVACAAAVAAQKYNRPVRINLDRDVDMSISGQRHAFFYTYRAGCKADGSLTFLSADLYNNAGYSFDLSMPVMDRALFHSDNAYRFPAMKVVGHLCKTNMPSHTAFRGFGGPQGMILAETVLEHLSVASGIDVHTMRTTNMYREGDHTHYKQVLEDFFLPRMWNDIHERADVAARKQAVEEFNSKNRWKKRGLCVLPTKFGISFTAQFYNQAGALVHVYTDGSVLVSHGGTEMGQGLHTKIIQVVAHAFGIPHSSVHIAESATNAIANSSPTAASASSDLYGMAVLDACQQILDRLEPVKESMPGVSWAKVVFAAYFKRINLSAQGFYITPSDRCGYTWDLSVEENHKLGQPFNYFTLGVACTEVEIDVLTGDSRILRADILMDLGKSINPALDIGQIEGAYVQGFGWSTIEEIIWGDSQHKWVRPGQLFSRGPGFYKIPAFNDVPCDFRVHLADTHNKFAVHSSKAVGEPPFFLGVSAFLAIKHAINASRAENGHSEYYPLYLPASSERIRMACADAISQKCVSNDSQFTTKGSW